MLELPREVRDHICVHAREGYPHEVCGLLLGKMHGTAPGERREAIVSRRAKNLNAERPHDRYLMDPSDMNAADTAARELGLEIVGFYHSHPDHPAIASRTDLENSSPWGGYSYPIVSVVKGDVADLRSWTREDDRWVEEKITGGDTMATVRIPTPLRPLTKGQSEVAVRGGTIREIVANLGTSYAGMRERIVDEQGEVRRFVNVFVNKDDIRALKGLETEVKDGDVVSILPAIAGGTPTFGEWKKDLLREIPEVLSRDVQTARDKGEDVVLIDVRTQEEWDEGHAPGAIHLDRGFLEIKVEQAVPDKSKRVVCYCAGGTRSLFAAKALKTLGYEKVESLTKGFGGWKEAGLAFTVPAKLSEADRRRYSRHLLIPEVGEEGQVKLLQSKVLLIGAGGLGCPAGIYLAAAGVGTLGIVDDDVVEESNLQRQILHTTDRLGQPKTESAKKAITDMNPGCKVVTYQTRLTSENVLSIFSGYDLIVDGSDNFPTRYLVNDACVQLKKPCVHGSIYRFEGQLTVFWPGKGPCYRCLYPAPPPPELAPSCAEAGVLGVLPGVIGVLEAIEALKIIVGFGEPLVGKLVHYDALTTTFRELKLRADPKCDYCAPGATFPGLIDYELFCASGATSSHSPASKPAAAPPATPELRELKLTVTPKPAALAKNDGGSCS
jgi:molybdopterin/thiamine biosynthesis adenylyltransferase/proteasome lid subunit RPN8/RPN11/rhodanese-related sulfurtransferase/molybdopterin converting factor small subunit